MSPGREVRRAKKRRVYPEARRSLQGQPGPRSSPPEQTDPRPTILPWGKEGRHKPYTWRSREASAICQGHKALRTWPCRRRRTSPSSGEQAQDGDHLLMAHRAYTTMRKGLKASPQYTLKTKRSITRVGSKGFSNRYWWSNLLTKGPRHSHDPSDMTIWAKPSTKKQVNVQYQLLMLRSEVLVLIKCSGACQTTQYTSSKRRQYKNALVTS